MTLLLATLADRLGHLCLHAATRLRQSSAVGDDLGTPPKPPRWDAHGAEALERDVGWERGPGIA